MISVTTDSLKMKKNLGIETFTNYALLMPPVAANRRDSREQF